MEKFLDLLLAGVESMVVGRTEEEEGKVRFVLGLLVDSSVVLARAIICQSLVNHSDL